MINHLRASVPLPEIFLLTLGHPFAILKPKRQLLAELLFSRLFGSQPMSQEVTCSWGWRGRSREADLSRGPGQPHALLAGSNLFLFLPRSLFPATIKPPDVTCIPAVRSIQMIIHPTSTPLRDRDGHRLTLEDIFHDLFYRLDLHINQTYQMVNKWLLHVPPSSFPAWETHFPLSSICIALRRKEMCYIN